MTRKRQSGSLRLRRGMDRGARLWLYHTARRYHWRVARWMGLDDLIQEGGLVWDRVCRKYPDANVANQMALFKVSFINRLNTLANKHSRRCKDTLQLDLLETQMIPPLHDETAELLVYITELPELLRRVVRRIMVDPELFRRPRLRRINGSRETTNERLCAIAGVDAESYDLHTWLYETLKSR